MKLLFQRYRLLIDYAASIGGKVEDCGAWLADPLSHPAIKRMSQRDIADLPFHASVGWPRR